MDVRANIGVIGGSGFYRFFEDVEEIEIDTPYGRPSDKIAVAAVGDKKVAFIPRHGKNHQFPPHMVPYRANIYAMKQLGVKHIVAPCACGSLQPHIKPGDFVVCDQFIDRTSGRKDTFFDGPEVKHISSAYPYDEKLRKLAISTARELDITIHETGTVVVIQGPRFSTKAESRWFFKIGCDIVNMTQYPECYLALEMEIPYVNISIVTDYDAGLEGCDYIKPVTMESALKTFYENVDKVKNLICRMIAKIE